MHDTGKLKDFIENHYYSPLLLESGDFYKASCVLQDMAKPAFEWLLQNYDAQRMQAQNEAQLEAKFLFPFYQVLGFAYTVQDGLSFQGKSHKLDALIFASEAELQEYEAKSAKLGKEVIYQISPPIIAEHKQYSTKIDNNKVKDNPHHQLTNYLATYRVHLGFLTNGRYWRFYDVSTPTANKIYYQIDLGELVRLAKEDPDQEGLEYFMYFYAVFSGAGQFKQIAYETKEEPRGKRSVIADLAVQNHAELEKIRLNLRDLIYSAENSIVELVGLRLREKHPEESLGELFNQSVIFALRILFISYFEQKHWSLLLQHEHYKDYSLQSIAEDLLIGSSNKSYLDIQDLFEHLAKGNDRRKIPLFNGGLFNKEKAPLLDDDKLLSSDHLRFILKKIYPVLEHNGKKTLPPSLQQLSVQGIGDIYESLLDYRFRVDGRDIVLVNYQEGGREIEAYLDVGDWAGLKARAKKEEGKSVAKREVHIISEKVKVIAKGQLFLVNASMQRKQSASYYTPIALSRPLVEAAVEAALKGAKEDILSIKILDNSCGSGHFLVDVLDALTRHILEHIQEYPALEQELSRERGQVQQQVHAYISGYEVDELVVLKRLLLKKVLYGVDADPLAIELSCLSLWLDTFIFGTPLSFIEHHIKCGNALMGTNITEVRDNLTGKENHKVELFTSIVNEQIDILENSYLKLDNINDIRSEEVEESKRIYQQVQVDIQSLRHMLDLITCYHWYNGLNKDKLASEFLPQPKLLATGKHKVQVKPFMAGFEAVRSHIEAWLVEPNEYQPNLADLSQIAKQYKFFHYELEFPEAFSAQLRAQGKQGFTVIIGNPPWDKVKLAEDDFFPQFISNYRQLSKAQKNAKVESLELDAGIKAEHERAKWDAKIHSCYYKHRYPLNSGSGDTNLFRLFMEKNLSLLAPGASLCYLSPSSWSCELGSVALRKHIIKNYRIGFFYQFENRKNLFPAIDNRMKFAIFQIVKEAAGEAIPCRFMLQSAEELAENASKLHYPIELLQELDSEQWSLLEAREQEALDIAQKLYRKGSALAPEYLDFHRELDMTMDSDLFIEGMKEGYDTEGDEEKSYFPLYQGKHIHQFNQAFTRPFAYYLEQEATEQRLQGKEISRMAKALGNAAGLKELGLDRASLQASHAFDYQRPRLAFRDVASNTNERTVIMALLPPGVSAGHSLWLSTPYRYGAGAVGQVLRREEPLEKLLWLMGLCNSLALDFIARLFVDIHVNKTYFMRLPFVQPTVEELNTTEDYRQIIGLSACLVLSYDVSGAMEKAIPQLRQCAGFCKLKPAKNLEARQKQQNSLRIELDLAVAQLYGLKAQELRYMLASFPGMQKKQPQFCALLKERLKHFA